MAKLEGFTCYIRNAQVCDGITIVLRQIKHRRPRDFARLQEKVKGFRWLGHEERIGDTATMGQWMCDPGLRLSREFRTSIAKRMRDEYAMANGISPALVHPDRASYLAQQEIISNQFIWPGKVALSRRLISSEWIHTVATIAHELGHAATTEYDFDRRYQEIGSPEWASEGCADYYAYRWGFGREIRRHNRERSFAHHGGLPGDVINPFDNAWFRVTRNFHYLPVREPEN